MANTIFDSLPGNVTTTKFGIDNNSENGGNVSNLYPYYKYTWTASFSFDESSKGAKATDASSDSSGGEDAGGAVGQDISDVTLKTFEMPRWTTDTQVVNQYNHKTVVQTKLNYEPITVSFYDQQNDVVDKLIWDFVKGQFDPNDGSKKAEIKPLKVVIKMHKNSGGALESSAKTYTLGKAFIVDAQHDTLDYSTSDVVLWTITLRYETLDTDGFEGAPPGPPPQKPKEEKTQLTKPEATQTPPAPPATPPAEPIPDASPGLMQLEGFSDPYGTTDAAWIANAPVNHNPTGLSTVLDQQRSRDRANRTVTPPGPSSGNEYSYTGYESAFIPTAPGIGGTTVGSPSTGANGTRPAPTNSRVDRATAVNNSEVKVERQGNTTRITQTRAITDPAEKAQVRREIQDVEDRVWARRTGQTVEQVRAGRERNFRELDRKTKNIDF